MNNRRDRYADREWREHICSNVGMEGLRRRERAQSRENARPGVLRAWLAGMVCGAGLTVLALMLAGGPK